MRKFQLALALFVTACQIKKEWEKERNKHKPLFIKQKTNNMKKVLIIGTLTLVPLLYNCNTKKEQTSDAEEVMEFDVNKSKGYEIPRTKVIPIQDSKTGGQYELYVKLPEDYSKHQDSIHPVIYFTDAIWHMNILSASSEYLMENAILVGISWQKDISASLLEKVGPEVSRYRDYSIQESRNEEHQAKYQFGQAGNHMSFIKNDVIPYVEENYRTDPENRSYFGYSLGGLFGAYILLSEPDTFNNYILGSPSVQGDVPLLKEMYSTITSKNQSLQSNVFISYGDLEKELGSNVDEFISVLKSKNNRGPSLEHVVLKGTHQTAFPLTGIEGVRWLSDLIKP